MAWALRSLCGPLLSAHLLTTSKLAVVWPAAIMRPLGETALNRILLTRMEEAHSCLALVKLSTVAVCIHTRFVSLWGSHLLPWHWRAT